MPGRKLGSSTKPTLLSVITALNHQGKGPVLPIKLRQTTCCQLLASAVSQHKQQVSADELCFLRFYFQAQSFYQNEYMTWKGTRACLTLRKEHWAGWQWQGIPCNLLAIFSQLVEVTAESQNFCMCTIKCHKR